MAPAFGCIHDFANYAAAAETDRRAIETIGAVLSGSERPFIVTSGTALADLMRLAREKGVSGYIGEGRNRWHAVHLLDAAHLYRLVIDKEPYSAALSCSRG